MREIKFRAWDKESKIMYLSSDEIKHLGSWFDAHLPGALANEENVLIMQYTGVNDNKGNNAYEYDMIMYQDDSVDYITFYNGCFCTANSGYLLDEIGDFEIIGHLFDDYWKNSTYAKQIK